MYLSIFRGASNLWRLQTSVTVSRLFCNWSRSYQPSRLQNGIAETKSGSLKCHTLQSINLMDCWRLRCRFREAQLHGICEAERTSSFRSSVTNSINLIGQILLSFDLLYSVKNFLFGHGVLKVGNTEQVQNCLSPSVVTA